MVKYEKPTVLVNEEVSEGVYTDSGKGCYTVTASLHQDNQVGRHDYRIQVNGKHDADHTCEHQLLTISFNQPVTYKSSTGTLEGSGTGTTLTIAYSYHNNPVDNIGLGDLVVESEEGLAIAGVQLTD